jgi:hypothetical protein
MMKLCQTALPHTADHLTLIFVEEFGTGYFNHGKKVLLDLRHETINKRGVLRYTPPPQTHKGNLIFCY